MNSYTVRQMANEDKNYGQESYSQCFIAFDAYTDEPLGYLYDEKHYIWSQYNWLIKQESIDAESSTGAIFKFLENMKGEIK